MEIMKTEEMFEFALPKIEDFVITYEYNDYIIEKLNKIVELNNVILEEFDDTCMTPELLTPTQQLRLGSLDDKIITCINDIKLEIIKQTNCTEQEAKSETVQLFTNAIDGGVEHLEHKTIAMGFGVLSIDELSKGVC